MSAEVVLRTHSLVKRFGGIIATDRVSLAVKRGARHALIGLNGAGKTTLINQLTGMLHGRPCLLNGTPSSPLGPDCVADSPSQRSENSEPLVWKDVPPTRIKRIMVSSGRSPVGAVGIR
jgi:energy-coupling factor transporter ATP-binding protein EcfA2